PFLHRCVRWAARLLAFCRLIPRAPSSTLFPYTTLFRSEERRLAYVGITRAQKELTFTLCKERRQYGELVRPEPSRFLLELPQDDLIWEQERKVVSAEERMQKGQSHLANLKAMMAAKRGK